MVPDWLAEVLRPKKVPVPWGTMARAVFAVWVPMAVAFGTGRRELALLPALGALLSISIDIGGPYWDRVKRIGTSAIFGGAPGLLIGTLIYGRGWVAVGAVVVVAGASAIMTRLGAVGSVTGLQLFVYSALGLGPLGALRPWWHTALEWGAGVAWALLLIMPGFLLSPRSAERKAVAAVYHAIAAALRAISTEGPTASHQPLATALNGAYDAMLTGRASASGRSQRDMHLMAVLNASHPLLEAMSALRATGEHVPPWVTDTIDRLGDAVLGEHGPGAGVLGTGGSKRRGRRRGGRRSGPPALPMIPPEWSPSPGALALREGMVSLARVISGNWAPPTAPPDPADSPGLRARLRGRLVRLGELLAGGQIAWEYTFRLMLCTGVAAVLSEVLPLQRSYWLVLTVGIILKPDFGSVFARAVQRAIGTVVGAVLGAAILAIVPYGPWLLLPFGVLAALLPYARARNFGLVTTFLTPLVVLLLDLLDKTGWRLAEIRLIDTVVASAVVLVVGYAPWPSAWQAHLPGQFAGALRAVCDYMDEALVPPPVGQAAQVPAHAPAGTPAPPRPASGPACRRPARVAVAAAAAGVPRAVQHARGVPADHVRADRGEPPGVGLVAGPGGPGRGDGRGDGGRGGARPGGHAAAARLGSPADRRAPRGRGRDRVGHAAAAGPLPADPQLEPVTDAVRSVLAMLTPGGGDAARGEPAALAPA